MVVVGDENFRSQIIPPDADLTKYKDACIVEIPEDFRHDFELDCDSALRDLAGISTLSVSNFMSNVASINAIVDHKRKHPFFCARMDNHHSWDSRSHYQIDWHELTTVDDDGTRRPKRNPYAKRFAHFDPGKSGDSFGLAIVHVAGLLKIMSSQSDAVEYQPVFDVDFVLEIKGTPEKHVLFRNVRRIIYDFQEAGFYFSRITMDNFQTTEMHQALQAVGYNTGYLSVDTSREPYVFLRRVIYEGRLRSYPHQKLLEELKKLEDTGDAIDHPQGFSKDVSDAVCGAVWQASQELTFSETIIESGEYLPTPTNSQANEQQELYHHSDDDRPKKHIPPPPITNAAPTKVYKKVARQQTEATYKKGGKEQTSNERDNILDVIDFG